MSINRIVHSKSICALWFEYIIALMEIFRNTHEKRLYLLLVFFFLSHRLFTSFHSKEESYRFWFSTSKPIIYKPFWIYRYCTHWQTFWIGSCQSIRMGWYAQITTLTCRLFFVCSFFSLSVFVSFINQIRFFWMFLSWIQ